MKAKILVIVVVSLFGTKVKSQITPISFAGKYDGSYGETHFTPYPFPHFQTDTGSMSVEVITISATTFKVQWGGGTVRNCHLNNDSTFYTDNPFTCCQSGNRFYDSLRLSFYDGNGSAWGGGLGFDGLQVATSENINLTFIFPNPFHFTATLYLENDFVNAELIIYNVLGERVRRQKIISRTAIINRNGLADGIYIFQVTSEIGIVKSGKLLIE